MNSNRTRYASTPAYGMQKRSFMKKPAASRQASQAPDFTQAPDPLTGTPFQAQPPIGQPVFPPVIQQPAAPVSQQPPMMQGGFAPASFYPPMGQAPVMPQQPQPMPFATPTFVQSGFPLPPVQNAP